MSLIIYELRKILAGRLLLIAILVSVSATTILFVEPWNWRDTSSINQVAQNNRRNKPVYDFLSSASSFELSEYLNETGFSLDMDTWSEEVSFDFEREGKILPTIGDEYNAFLSYLTRYQYIYPRILNNRSTIVETARFLGGTAYVENDIYKIRLNLDIIQRYSVQPALIPALSVNGNNAPAFSVYNSTGWDKFFTFMCGDLFALLMTLIVSAHAFSMEKKTRGLLKTTLKGHTCTAITKLFVVCIVAVSFSLLFSTLTYIISTLMYGTSGSGASILSVTPSMESSFITITIKETVILFTIYKIFGTICFSLVCVAISSFVLSELASYIGGLILLGLSYTWHYLMISKTSIPFAFRLLPDVTLWTRPVWMFGEYRVANILNHPVLWVWLCFAFWFVIAIVMIVTVLYRWRIRRSV